MLGLFLGVYFNIFFIGKFEVYSFIFILGLDYWFLIEVFSLFWGDIVKSWKRNEK